MKIIATGLPESVEAYQLALNATFAGGVAYGKGKAQRKPLSEEVKQELWRLSVLEASKEPYGCVPMNWQRAADLYAQKLEASHGIKA